MLFADDISTFSVIHGPVASVKAKNKDLLKKGIDLFNEKMASILEQVQKGIFSGKTSIMNRAFLTFEFIVKLCP